MKCNDCGRQDYETQWGRRADVCPDCDILRGKLVEAMGAGKFTLPQFQGIQRKIANSNGSGRGARAMREALGLDQPQI